MDKKVIFVGLDGATWTQFDKFLQNNTMPNLNNILKSGTKGSLKSYFPFTSSSSWLSILTGSNPGKHGVPYWGTEERSEIPILWEILSEQNIKNLIVNDLSTYPPLKINGIMITGGELTPHNAENFVYPEEIKQELDKVVGGYTPSIDPLFNQLLKDSKFQEAYEIAHEHDKKVVESFFYLAEKYDWQMLGIMLENPDILHHHYWDKPEYLEKFHSWVDSVLGKIYSLSKEQNANLIIVSDHGGRGVNKHFLINTWLKDSGLVKFGQSGIITKAMTKSHLRQDVLRKQASKMHMREFLSKIIPESLKKKIPLHIDEENTKAISKVYGTITVKEKDAVKYEELRTKIIDQLLELRDDGKKVVVEALRKEEAFSGPYVDRANDIQFLLNEGYRWSPHLGDEGYLLNNEKYGDSIRVGDHSPEGIIIAVGPDFAKGKILQKMPLVWDVCATILHIFNIKIPSYFDGTPIKEIFDQSSDLSTKNILIEDKSIPTEKKDNESPYTKEQEKQIEKNLKALGYI